MGQKRSISFSKWELRLGRIEKINWLEEEVKERPEVGLAFPSGESRIFNREGKGGEKMMKRVQYQHISRVACAVY